MSELDNFLKELLEREKEKVIERTKGYDELVRQNEANGNK